MTQESLKILIGKHLDGQLSEEEKSILEEWAQQEPVNRTLLNRFSDLEWVAAMLVQWEKADPLDGYEKWEIVQARRRSNVFRLAYWTAAAGIILVFGMLWLHRSDLHGKGQSPVPNKEVAQTILPGRNTAVLTLSNGRQILLDSTGNGEVTRQGGVQLIKVDSGSLSYRVTGDSSNDDLAINTLSVPRAGQFQLLLPDGSHVWLNTASSIRYPVSFRGQERVVELTGEAYFDVAKDPGKPFRVKMGNQVITVLGTEFNIMGYPDEQAIQTTLVRGSIRIDLPERSVVLKPEEQSSWLENGSLRIKKVDTEQFTDWRKGLFHFDCDLQTAMRQLSRWYDVDIEVRDPLKNKILNGAIYRDLTLKQVLDNLGGGLHFTIEGRHVIILP